MRRWGMQDIVFRGLNRDQMVGCRKMRMGPQIIPEKRISKVAGRVALRNGCVSAELRRAEPEGPGCVRSLFY